MRNSARKIAIVLHNCTAHGLTNIKPVFLPPNTTVKTQPLDSGVIRCLKAHYRKSFAKLRLLAFEEKKDFTVKILEAMKLFRQAWNSVSEVTVQICFKKINFICLEVEDEGVEEAEDEDVEEAESNVNRDAEGIWERLWNVSGTMWLVPETFDFSEYAKSDENIVTRETVTRVTFYVAYKL